MFLEPLDYKDSDTGIKIDFLIQWSAIGWKFSLTTFIAEKNTFDGKNLEV